MKALIRAFLAAVVALALVCSPLACGPAGDDDAMEPGGGPPETEPPAEEPTLSPEPAQPPATSEAEPPTAGAEPIPEAVASREPQQVGEGGEPQSGTESRPCQGSLSFGGLVTDLQRYETTNVNVHSGDLYEHSVWAAKAIEEWFDNGEVWTEGLEETDRCVAVVAAFLHDIGKAGDNDTEFFDKKRHAKVGRGYLLGKAYRLENGARFDFDGWFQQLGLSQADKRLVVFLVAVHRALGEEIMARVENPGSCEDLHDGQQQLLTEQYLQRLESAWDGAVDGRLISLAMLITAADVLAMQPVRHPSELFSGDLPDDLEPPHAGKDMYHEQWNYDTKGVLVRDCVLEHFEKTRSAA